MCEVAFETCDLTISEQPTVVRGVIDLVFQDRHESPWVIVDYKTDRISIQTYQKPFDTTEAMWKPTPVTGQAAPDNQLGNSDLLYEYRSLA